MHPCLCISEILVLIFEFIRSWDDQLHLGPNLPVGKKTLASLARTCHLFSSPALDILWCELYSIGPLLKIFPVVTSDVDDAQWSTFRKYAKRVKTIHGGEERISVPAKKDFISSLRHYPKAYLPLLPNVTKLEWSELSLAPREDSSISLLRYFASPVVTTITLSFVRWLAYSSVELALLADLPRLCPNITSFTFAIRLSWDCEPTREVGIMVAQWPRLQHLRTCAIAQSVMDQLFDKQLLHVLSIDYHESSPIYIGRIPDTVREFSLSVERPRSCTRFLGSMYASPVKFSLLVGMNEGKEEADVEDMFSLLPCHLDRSRLQSLTIQTRSTIAGIPLWSSLELQASLVSVLVEFKALRELDLDLLCTAHISDVDYARMAASLTRLESLKLGTADPSITRPRPTASIKAVIAVLTHCNQLEKLHFAFDGSIPPPEGSTEVGRFAWGVSNKRITKLVVGYSPIGIAAVGSIASCLKSIMPELAQIEYKDRSAKWNAVRNTLERCRDGIGVF